MVVPVDSTGFEAAKIEMDLILPESQWSLFFDDLRLPGDALVGEEDAAISQLFAGLNPERIMASAAALGSGPVRARQGIGIRQGAFGVGRRTDRDPPGRGPPAGAVVHRGRARETDDAEGGDALRQRRRRGRRRGRQHRQVRGCRGCGGRGRSAIQTHGGNGLTVEYGLASMLGNSRLSRVAPVSREMILNFVAQHNLGLPKSY